MSQFSARSLLSTLKGGTCRLKKRFWGQHQGLHGVRTSSGSPPMISRTKYVGFWWVSLQFILSSPTNPWPIN